MKREEWKKIAQARDSKACEQGEHQTRHFRRIPKPYIEGNEHRRDENREVEHPIDELRGPGQFDRHPPCRTYGEPPRQQEISHLGMAMFKSVVTKNRIQPFQIDLLE